MSEMKLIMENWRKLLNEILEFKPGETVFVKTIRQGWVEAEVISAEDSPALNPLKTDSYKVRYTSTHPKHKNLLGKEGWYGQGDVARRNEEGVLEPDTPLSNMVDFSSREYQKFAREAMTINNLAEMWNKSVGPYTIKIKGYEGAEDYKYTDMFLDILFLAAGGFAVAKIAQGFGKAAVKAGLSEIGKRKAKEALIYTGVKYGPKAAQALAQGTKLVTKATAKAASKLTQKVTLKQSKEIMAQIDRDMKGSLNRGIEYVLTGNQLKDAVSKAIKAGIPLTTDGNDEKLKSMVGMSEEDPSKVGQPA